MFTDPSYVQKLTWWEKFLNWWGVNRETAFYITLIASMVLIAIPGTQAFGIGMFTAAMYSAAIGGLIGGAVAGLTALANGSDVMAAIHKGIVTGFMDGFITGALFFAVGQGVRAIARVANNAKAAKAIKAADTVTAQAGNQPNCPNGVDDIKVIGRLEDTVKYKGQAGFDVLDDPMWSLQKNDAWVQSGINNQQKFLVVSELSPKNLISVNPKFPGPTVFARELDMLSKAGYVWKGQFLIPGV